jgi:hypothetical protein
MALPETPVGAAETSLLRTLFRTELFLEISSVTILIDDVGFVHSISTNNKVKAGQRLPILEEYGTSFAVARNNFT